MAFPCNNPTFEYRGKTYTEEEFRQHLKDMDLVEASNYMDVEAIPEAPFKNNWHELAFKKALRYAIENGYEKFLWTTGALQIDRYNSLTIQAVDKISYAVSQDEYNVRINATKDGHEKFTEAIPLKGTTIISGREVSLDSLLGKEMANKIRETKNGTLEGEDLSIGGQFHKNLYDNRLPSFAKKYLKKFGIDLKKEVIDEESILQRQVGDIYRKEVASDIVDQSANYRKAFEEAFSNPDTFVVKGYSSNGEQPQVLTSLKDLRQVKVAYIAKRADKEGWSFDINNEMVESILGGQPLYIKAKPEEMSNIYKVEPENITNSDLETLVKQGTFSVLTPIKEGMTKDQRTKALAEMQADLDLMGYRYVPSQGIYKGMSIEDGFFVYYKNTNTSRVLQFLGNKYNQESVLHGSGGKYSIETSDGSTYNTQLVKTGNFDGDGTVVKDLKFSMDFDWDDVQPASKNYSLVPAEARYNARKESPQILSIDDIENIYNSDVELVDAKNQPIDKKKRDLLGSMAVFQDLIKTLHPNLEELSKPEFFAPIEEKQVYRAKVAERYISAIESTLDKWNYSDPDSFGATWYSESPNEFAKRVGRDVEDVNNDVVKLWLFLATAVTSPRADVPVNVGYSTNFIASLVRFYENGKFDVPKFQYDNEGKLILNDKNTPKKLGLGSPKLEKIQALAKGYIPVDTQDGLTLMGEQEIVGAKELFKDSVFPKTKYVFNPKLKEMIDQYGELNGIINYLISPPPPKDQNPLLTKSQQGIVPNNAMDIFGNKLGAFMSNLMGISQIPTIDTWMNRFFMGLTGDSLKITRHKNGKIKSVKDNSVNFDPEEGDLMRGAIQKATDNWNRTHKKQLTPADTQAIIWTQVKNMFNSLMTKERANVDLAEAYDMIRKKRNIKAMSNPAIAEVSPQAPVVKSLLSDDFGKHYAEDFYMDGVEFAIKSREGILKDNYNIDTSTLDPRNFDDWVDVASRLVKDGFLAEDEVTRIKELTDRGDKEQLEKYILSLNQMGVLEVFANVGRVSLLLGVKNLAKNVVGNELNQFATEVARVPAWLLDVGMEKVAGTLGKDYERSVTMTHKRVLPFSEKSALGKQAREEVWRAVKEGDNILNFEHPSLFRDREVQTPFGFVNSAMKPLVIYQRYGWRLQGAIDKPFKIQAYERRLNELVKLKQLNEKKNGRNLTHEEALNELTFADYDQAWMYSLEATFQDANQVADWYYTQREKVPSVTKAFLDHTFKFVKTPLNVVDETLNYSGLYPIIKTALGLNQKFEYQEWKNFRELVKNNLDNPNNRRLLAFTAGKGAIGLTMSIIGYQMAQAGILTSFFDDDYSERDQMTAKNVSYGTINVNGTEVDISWLSPVSFFLLAGGAWATKEQKQIEKLAEAQKKLDEANEEGDKTKIENAMLDLQKVQQSDPKISAVGQIIKNIALQTPLLRQATDLWSAVEKAEKRGDPQSINTFVGADTFVPAIVKEIAETKDTMQRVSNNSSIGEYFTDKVKSKIPSVDFLQGIGQYLQDTDLPVVSGVGYVAKGREELPIRYDMLGRPIETSYGLDPFKTQKVKTEKLADELDRLNISISHDFRGDYKRQNEKRREKGQFIDEHLQKVVNSDIYSKVNDDKKKDLLNSSLQLLYREYGKDKLKPEEETHNLNMILERENFMDVIKNRPESIRKDRPITDDATIKAMVRVNMNSVNSEEILKSIDEDFIKKEFSQNFNVSANTSLDEAKKKFEEFQKDPEMFIIKEYIKTKSSNIRKEQNAKRREELKKQGKSEEEIKKIMSRESSKLGYKTRRRPKTMPIQ